MKLHVAFSRDEIVTFAGQWLPLKLLLGGPTKDERFLQLSDPSAIELVPNAGLRIACRAQIRWPVLGITVPITARSVSVLLRPSIAQIDQQPALVFRPKIEHADLSGVPARLDATVTDAINRALSERVKPTWQFGTMLTRTIAMPAILATTSAIDLQVQSGAVEVSHDAFTFQLTLSAAAPRRSTVAEPAAP
jgi:hypothetical protein